MLQSVQRRALAAWSEAVTTTQAERQMLISFWRRSATRRLRTRFSRMRAAAELAQVAAQSAEDRAAASQRGRTAAALQWWFNWAASKRYLRQTASTLRRRHASHLQSSCLRSWCSFAAEGATWRALEASAVHRRTGSVQAAVLDGWHAVAAEGRRDRMLAAAAAAFAARSALRKAFCCWSHWLDVRGQDRC